MADALSRRPQISNVTIAYHQDLARMREHYAIDSDYKEIWQPMQEGQSSSQYSVKEGYLMKDDCICITQEMRQKILDECHAPPYARHRGITATIKALERYFFCPAIRKDIHQYITECLIMP